eukprot:gene6928-9559_t
MFMGDILTNTDQLSSKIRISNSLQQIRSVHYYCKDYNNKLPTTTMTTATKIEATHYEVQPTNNRPRQLLCMFAGCGNQCSSSRRRRSPPTNPASPPTTAHTSN